MPLRRLADVELVDAGMNHAGSLLHPAERGGKDKPTGGGGGQEREGRKKKEKKREKERESQSKTGPAIKTETWFQNFGFKTTR